MLKNELWHFNLRQRANSAREIQNLENVQEKTFIAMQFPIVNYEMPSPPPLLMQWNSTYSLPFARNLLSKLQQYMVKYPLLQRFPPYCESI